MVDQEKIFNRCLSDDPEDRIQAIKQYWKVRSNAVKVLGSLFSEVSDKQQVWNDLLRMLNLEDSDVRSSAVTVLDSAFSEMPDKQQAWSDIHRLTNDENWQLRSRAAFYLGSSFSQMPDKQQAWEDLHRMTSDEVYCVRSSATVAIGSAFSQIPDKQQAWEDLHRMTYDENGYSRCRATDALGFAFSQVPDKQQAWDDLHRLTKNGNRSVRSRAAIALGSAFSQVPDKQQAWDDLYRLTNDDNYEVRSSAVYAIDSAFSQVPNKQKAWDVLHRMVKDKDWHIRSSVAFAIGSTFYLIPDKQQAWNDLYRLNKDKENHVRTNSYHSLGKVSVFKASQTETNKDYKKELEKSIKFFEKAVRESDIFFNPSQFCLPFYRSFHTIMFKKQEAKEEVDKYLEEAKARIVGSEGRKQLFEAVENLAEALKEIQNLGNLDLEAKKSELNFYRKYCDHAAELLKDTYEKAPFATEVLRKGLPILDRNLKGIVEEIHEKAKTAYKESKGTNVQETALAVCKEVQKWEIGSQEEVTENIEDLVLILRSNIPDIPENKHIFEKIEKIRSEPDIAKQYKYLIFIISVLPKAQVINMTQLNVNIDNNRQAQIHIDSISQIIGNNQKEGFKIEEIKPTIGIITALPIEYAAVNILLENKNENYAIPGAGAGRRYCLGEISSEDGNKHKIVLTIAGMGNNIAATRASLLLEHFPNIRSIIMVGIAGGVPNPRKDKVDEHVRLGDIVISDEYGVLQYDFIKQEIQAITLRNPPRPPSSSLIEAVKYLDTEDILGNHPWKKYIDQALYKLKIHRPSEKKDILYDPDNQKEVIPHPKDPKRIKGQPRVFLGHIASSNILQKNPTVRDYLRDEFKVKAIEMEGSGIADATWTHEAGYLVVRGICDYCDPYKNDNWQKYAAIVAAAYTRALIESMP